LERGVEGTVFDFKSIAGSLLDEFGNGVAVQGSPAEGAEDDEVESALNDFEAVGVAFE
jgi:hypothetical protein